MRHVLHRWIKDDIQTLHCIDFFATGIHTAIKVLDSDLELCSFIGLGLDLDLTVSGSDSSLNWFPVTEMQKLPKSLKICRIYWRLFTSTCFSDPPCIVCRLASDVKVLIAGYSQKADEARINDESQCETIITAGQNTPVSVPRRAVC